MYPVKSVSCDLDPELMRKCRDMKKTVRASGYCCMDIDRIFKTFKSYDLARAHLRHECQFHRLPSRFPRIVQKIRTGRRHQSASRQCQPKGFRHDLHGGGGPNKGACPAARTRILLCPVQLLLADLSPLVSGTVFSKLFQCQHIRSRVHGPAQDHQSRNIRPGQPDQISRESFVTACQIDSCVKRCRIRMDFDHVGDHLAAHQTEIDPVCSLAFPVTDIRTEISGSEASGFLNPLSHFFNKNVQMPAARMAVPESTFNDDLRLSQILRLPPGPDAQRIQFRRYPAHFLTF